MALPGPSSDTLVGSSYDRSLVQKSAAELMTGVGDGNVKYQPNGWYWSKIDGARWDKLYPFQVMVVEKTGPNTYMPMKGSKWTFTLPVPPESMRISMPFAINSGVTLDGAYEEHNGAPIRHITISGSFGVNPARSAAPTISNNIGFLDSIIGGTIQQASRLGSSAQNLASTQSGGSAYWKRNVYTESDFANSGEMAQYTGYYQWRLFQMFMEAYVELKKRKENRNARLAFAVWKDEAVYLVTPIVLDVGRSAASPLEYTYNFVMKATGRVKLGGAPSQVIPFMGVNRTPSGFLQRLLVSIGAARQVLLEAGRLPLALSNDVKAFGIEPLRELTFLAKDALGLPFAFADVADSFVSDAKWAIIDALNTVKAGKNIKDNVLARFKQTGKKAKEAAEMIAAVAAERRDNTASNDAPPNTPGKPSGPNRGTPTSHPAASLFDAPAQLYALLSVLLVGDVTLSPQLTSRLQDERNRIRNLGSNDLKLLAERLEILLGLVSDALGTGDATYDATFRGSPATSSAATSRGALTVKQPSDEDFETMYALNQVIMDLKSVIAAKTDENNRLMTALDYMAGLAHRSGIAFNVPVSKFAVPFPYGSTLESIALQYLGDASRWHEIAALNGLQEPYVDEVGFDQNLLVNGAGNTVVVADASRYFVGQLVWLSSNAVSRFKRRVVKIVHVSPTQHLISVDGDADLERLTVTGAAVIHAFYPNTVNSQMLLYIPSTETPGSSDFKTSEVPGVKEFDHLIVVGGVDFLLDSSNDLVIGPDGSDRWAVGLTNIVQKVRLAFATPKGSLLDNPEIGNPIKVGMSVADLDPSQAAETIRMMFDDDPSFSAVKAVQLDVQGPVAKVGTALQIAGTNQVVPISVEIRQS